MIRRILWGVGFLVIAVALWNGPLILYGINQGIGQLSIVWNARPVEEFMADPTFPDSLKNRLEIIDEVRRFAIDSLNLQDTENYKTLFDQKGKEVMWVVMASEPFQLKSKEWKFPIIGSVPYKGFFNEEKAIEEAQKLKEEGWDVSVRNPGGWSTLGWFTDPILSKMLERSEGDLASLIIHEMVHATLFIKDSVTFNENLASFIADTAAYDFLRWKYGMDSKEYKQYWNENEDYRKYSSFVLQAANQLDQVYTSFAEDESVDQKRMKKEQFIQQIVNAMDTLQLVITPNPSQRFKTQLPNNTFFMSYRQYQSKQTIFKEELDTRFSGDLKAYITFLTAKYPSL